MRDYRLIFDDETIYGFLPDIIKMLECDIEDRQEEDEVLTDALAEARALEKNDDDRYLYKCWYNQMGAYIFEKMAPITK